MSSINEFNRPVSTDTAPYGSICEWCGKPAEQLLTAIGGARHNTEGIFCRPCGEQFAQAVLQPLPESLPVIVQLSAC